MVAAAYKKDLLYERTLDESCKQPFLSSQISAEPELSSHSAGCRMSMLLQICSLLLKRNSGISREGYHD